MDTGARLIFVSISRVRSLAVSPRTFAASSSGSSRRSIRDKLNGAIHGAGGCFLDSFLDEIRARVAGESFWCRDFDLEREDRQQSEKLVACIGAPMACAGVLDDRRFRLHAIDATA